MRCFMRIAAQLNRRRRSRYFYRFTKYSAIRSNALSTRIHLAEKKLEGTHRVRIHAELLYPNLNSNLDL